MKFAYIDQANRPVSLPDERNRVCAPSPYAATLMISLSPEKLTSLVFKLTEEQKNYLPACVHNLPVIEKVTDTEAIMATYPDFVLVWGDKRFPRHEKSEKALNPTGIPYVYVETNELVDLNDYPAVYRFLGMILSVNERAEALAAYCEEALKEAAETVNSVHPQNRPRVYYAEGEAGFETEFSHSLHAHLLNLVGDVNVHRGDLKGHAGFERLIEEQIIAYDPEIIVVWRREAFNKMKENKDFWLRTSAGKRNKIYLIPQMPFNWFDRPPSFMRIIGLKWLLSICYPQVYKKDIYKETEEFFKLFLNTDFSGVNLFETL